MESKKTLKVNVKLVLREWSFKKEQNKALALENGILKEEQTYLADAHTKIFKNLYRFLN